MPWMENEQKLYLGRFSCEFSSSWFKGSFFIFYFFISCSADPLADLCLVPLRKDVDVGLQGAGFNHSFVPGGHREKRAAANVSQQDATGFDPVHQSSTTPTRLVQHINKDGSLKVRLYSSTWFIF